MFFNNTFSALLNHWNRNEKLNKILTPRRTVFFVKLTGPKLVKNFPAFYGTRRFITAVTRGRTLSLSWTRSVQSMPPSHFLKINSNIILPFTPRSSNWFVSLGFPLKNPVCTIRLPHTYYMPRPPHSPWFDDPNNIWWAQITKLLLTQSSSLTCYLVPLMPKYIHQHSILEHPQPMFLPQCDRPSFTPIKKNIGRKLHKNI